MTKFHEDLKFKMDEYARLIYVATRKFPREEVYGIASQLRRSGLSVILNYIEGYARVKDKIHRNFLEISYGSLKESKYLLFFSNREQYLSEKDYQELMKLAEDIGGMLWGILARLK
jgi:four helix bundle protein